MRKSEAYQALAVFMLSNKIELSKESEWLMNNQPQTLCKIYGLYNQQTTTQNHSRHQISEPQYITDLKNALNKGNYVEAIKVLRTHTRVGLKEAKFALDYALAKTTWSNLNESERNLYHTYIAGYGIG